MSAAVSAADEPCRHDPAAGRPEVGRLGGGAPAQPEPHLVGDLPAQKAEQPPRFPSPPPAGRKALLDRRQQGADRPFRCALRVAERQQLAQEGPAGGAVHHRVMEGENDLALRTAGRRPEVGAPHRRSGGGVDGPVQLVLGHPAPVVVAGPLHPPQPDRRRPLRLEPAAAVALDDVHPEQRVMPLQGGERPLQPLRRRPGVEPQHHHDDERRVLVGKRGGGLEAAQRSTLRCHRAVTLAEANPEASRLAATA